MSMLEFLGKTVTSELLTREEWAAVCAFRCPQCTRKSGYNPSAVLAYVARNSNAHGRRENCSRTDLDRFPMETGASVSAREVLRLIIQIDNSCTQPSAPRAVSQAVNGCAAHDWGQVLTFQGKIGQGFRSFTIGEGSLRIRWSSFSQCFHQELFLLWTVRSLGRWAEAW